MHTRPRAHRAPGIPCALMLEGKEIWEQTSGAVRGENAEVWLHPSPPRSGGEGGRPKAGRVGGASANEISRALPCATPTPPSLRSVDPPHKGEGLKSNRRDDENNGPRENQIPPAPALTERQPAEPLRRPQAIAVRRGGAICACARSIPAAERRPRQGSRRDIRSNRGPG
jgi:hypothetical protein